MALPPYRPDQKESRASLALTLSIAAIIAGVVSLAATMAALGPLIFLIGPLIGIAMLGAAGVCIYWLWKKDPNDRPRIRLAAQICTWTLALIALLAVGVVTTEIGF